MKYDVIDDARCVLSLASAAAGQLTAGLTGWFASVNDGG